MQVLPGISTYPKAPCSLYTDTVIISADRDDISSVLFLLSASPVASFRPLADKSHRQQRTQRLYPDGHVEKSTHQQRVGSEVMNCAAPQLLTAVDIRLLYAQDPPQCELMFCRALCAQTQRPDE